MAARKKVCFVSQRNACRSIIAQAYLLKHGFEYFDVQSFGLEPNRIHYLVYEVLEPKGFDLNFYFSKAYEVVERQKFDILVSMSPEVTANLPAIPYEYELVEWNYDDPTRNKMPEEDLKKEIEQLCERIESDVKSFIEKYRA